LVGQMTSSATIAHILDPLIDPRFAEQDLLLDKAFSSSDDQVTRDYVRGFKRINVDSLEWAGDKLLMACKDANLRLWDPERAEKERSWPGDWMSVQCDPNSPHTAAAVAWDGKFRVFDTRSSNTSSFDVDLKKTSSNMKEFLSLCWSPDSGYIAVSNRQDQVYVLDLRMPGTLRLGAHKSLQHEINQMVWSQDGDSLWLATGGTPGKLQVFPAPALNAVENPASVVAHQYAAISLAVDPQGRHIASGGGDCLVTLWDPRHLVCTGSFGYATQAVTTMSFNHTGNLLAWGTGNAGSTGGEKNLTIVGADTGTLHWQDSTQAPVQQVRWHPKKNVLAYTLNPSQLPEERDVGRERRGSGRDTAVVHTLKVPEIA